MTKSDKKIKRAGGRKGIAALFAVALAIADGGLLRTSTPDRGLATLSNVSASLARRRRNGLVEAGDVVMLEDGREALVTARVETDGRGPFAAFLEVVVAPTPLTSARAEGLRGGLIAT